MFDPQAVAVDMTLTGVSARVPWVLWNNSRGSSRVELKRLQCTGKHIGFDGEWDDGSQSNLRQTQISPFHLAFEMNQPQKSKIECAILESVPVKVVLHHGVDAVNANRTFRNRLMIDTHLRLSPHKDVGVLDGAAMHSTMQLLLRTTSTVIVFQKNVFTFVLQMKRRDEIFGRERVRLVLRDILLVSKKQMDWMMREWKLDLGGFYFDFTCCFPSVNWSVLLNFVRHMNWFMVTLSTRGFVDTVKAVEDKVHSNSEFRVTRSIANPSVVCFVFEKFASPLPAACAMKRKRLEETMPNCNPQHEQLKKGDLVLWHNKQYKIKRVPTEEGDLLCSLTGGLGAPMHELKRV
tara:strand:- start:15387 stop:16430 length:1044 start_codon:yes stop_codon:yes gene_type:complete